MPDLNSDAPKRTMTSAELARYDGKDGRKAYVAINDLIYDLSDSPRWQNGEHQEAIQAGRDLTKALRKARHMQSVLKKFPVVAYLDDPPRMSPQEAQKTTKVVFFFFLIITAVGAYLLMR